MRISTSEFYRLATQSLVDQQAALSAQQRRIASGREILNPSDDPVGAAQLVSFDNALQAIGQFERNANAAQSRLGVTEDSLAAAVDNLQRVRELTVAAANDAQTNESRAAIAKEIGERLDGLLAIANTRDANGEYIFAGNQTSVRPFRVDSAASAGVSYDGDDGQRLVSVDAARQVAINESGRRLFMTAEDGNGSFVTRRASEAALRLGAGNGGTLAAAGLSVVDASLYRAEPYRVLFIDTASPPDGVADSYDIQVQRDSDGDGVLEWVTSLTDVAPADGSADSPPAYSDPTTVTAIPGLEFALSGTPAVGDSLVVDPPVTGAAAIEPGQVLDVNRFVADTYTIVFDTSDPDAVTFDVLDSSGAVITDPDGNPASGIAYEPVGNRQTVTAIPGISVDITGTPANGDRFVIEPAGRRSVFQTYNELISTLETPRATPLQAAEFREEIDRVLQNLDQSLTAFIEGRADVGGRLRVVDDQVALNEDRELQYQGARSRIEDLDYAEAISQLQFQITAFQAAQQSFIRIQGLSLFRLIA